MKSRLPSLIAFLTLSACSGGGGGGAAPVANQFTVTTPDIFNGFAAPSPGGMFPGPQSAKSSAAVPGALFVSYNTGQMTQLYKLDVNTMAVQATTGSPFTLPGSSGKIPATTLNILNSGLALLCCSDSGSGDNAVVYVFNPSTLSSDNDFIALDLSIGDLLTVAPFQGALDSNGSALNQAYRANFPVGAAAFVLNNILKLYVAFSNVEPGNFPINRPGTILVYDVDLGATNPLITRSATIFTGRFNPTAMEAFAGLLYVTCEGGGDASFNDLPGSLEAFDPNTLTLAGQVQLGVSDPVSGLLVNDQGDLGYVISNPVNGTVSVHEIALNPAQLSQTIFIAESVPFSNFSNSVSVNLTGQFVYAQLPADRTIYVIDRDLGQVVDLITTPAPPGRSTSAFVDAPNFMARRPGDPSSVLFSVVSLQGGLATLDAILPSTR